MNILFLALDINIAKNTGDSIHVRELTSSFAKLGNKVIIITADVKEKNMISKWASNYSNITIYYNHSKSGSMDFKTASFCRKMAKKHDVQVIYERRNTPKISYLVTRFIRIPYVLEVNALVEEEMILLGKEKEDSSIKERMKKRFRRHFFRKANLVVAVTENIRNNVQKNYNISPQKVIAIPNGANTSLFTPLNKSQCQNDLGLSTELRYVCFSGNLAPWQGVKYLIDSVPNVIKKTPSVRFLIVGGGIQKKELEERAGKLQIENYVIFTNQVEYNQVPKYLNSGEICVAPMTTGRKKSGSSAIKIYEYLACGKPVIASNVPNLEFIQKNDCGLLISKDDPDSLGEAVIELLNDPELGKKMGERGRKLVVENYSWTNTARKIEVQLKKLL